MSDFTILPLVYIAGPYSNPDPVLNTRHAVQMSDFLIETCRVATHVPHLTMTYHLIAPHSLEWWYAYDLAVLKRCDAVFRLAGASTGADREVEFARSIGLPVFTSEAELGDWSRGWRRA
jgi:hypothetical protein